MLYLIPLVAALAFAAPVDQPGAAVQAKVGDARVAAAWDPTFGLEKAADSAVAAAGQALEFAPKFGLDKTHQARDLEALAQLAAEAADKFWGSVPKVISEIEDKVKEIKAAFKAKIDALDSAIGKKWADKIKAIEDKLKALKDAKDKIDAAAVEAIQAEIKGLEDLIKADKDFFDATIGQAIKDKINAIEAGIGAIAGLFHLPKRSFDDDLAAAAPKLGEIFQKLEQAFANGDANAEKAIQEIDNAFKNPGEIAPKLAQVVDSIGKQVDSALQGRPIYVPSDWNKGGKLRQRDEDEEETEEDEGDEGEDDGEDDDEEDDGDDE
ncbi:hypothetical protein A1Q2_03866 [Trichosporon asahii var. asahii CBS 8904]|uniref:Uncharacterized protein n=1 Tax=Trichosporon asahii var. asahii (strain CBS 8904) TaxID=1220162 RepID=K1VYI4_TRIAC|nr:hypothetical protein A1Q2_03866 [Trichosporon asahii var. asahii CBS 8904]